MGIMDQGVVMITGATSGVGMELARQLSSRAKGMILVAPKKDKLDDLAQELRKKNQNMDVMVHPIDVTNNEEVEKMMTSIMKTTQVDVLINNTCTGEFGLFEQSKWEETCHMIKLNVLATTNMTSKLLPRMIDRKKGGIINIASGNAFVTLPGTAVYTGTKNFIHGFTEGLQMEMMGTGVHIMEACPGPIYHPMMEKMPRSEPEGFNMLKISPKQAAYEIIRGFDAGQSLVLPGFIYRWSMYAASFIPGFAIRLGGRTLCLFARKNQPQLEHSSDYYSTTNTKKEIKKESSH